MPTLLASQQGTDMSLQVGVMPDLNPGLQVLQSGALPLSHHIPQEPPHPTKWDVVAQVGCRSFFMRKRGRPSVALALGLRL